MTYAEQAIEFAEWVAKEILDDNFEEETGFFAEVACRKLWKMGVVEMDGEVWRLKDD